MADVTGEDAADASPRHTPQLQRRRGVGKMMMTMVAGGSRMLPRYLHGHREKCPEIRWQKITRIRGMELLFNQLF